MLKTPEDARPINLHPLFFPTEYTESPLAMPEARFWFAGKTPYLQTILATPGDPQTPPTLIEVNFTERIQEWPEDGTKINACQTILSSIAKALLIIRLAELFQGRQSNDLSETDLRQSFDSFPPGKIPKVSKFSHSEIAATGRGEELYQVFKTTNPGTPKLSRVRDLGISTPLVAGLYSEPHPSRSTLRSLPTIFGIEHLLTGLCCLEASDNTQTPLEEIAERSTAMWQNVSIAARPYITIPANFAWGITIP